jgi:hypothetical protein
MKRRARAVYTKLDILESCGYQGFDTPGITPARISGSSIDPLLRDRAVRDAIRRFKATR